MNKKPICPDFCGDNCINGNCPAAIFDSEDPYSVEPDNCVNCAYNKGCAECWFSEGENICAIEVSPDCPTQRKLRK